MRDIDGDVHRAYGTRVCRFILYLRTDHILFDIHPLCHFWVVTTAFFWLCLAVVQLLRCEAVSILHVNAQPPLSRRGKNIYYASQKCFLHEMCVKYSNLSNGLFTHWVLVPNAGVWMNPWALRNSRKCSENHENQQFFECTNFSIKIFSNFSYTECFNSRRTRLGKNCRKSWRRGYFLLFTVFFMSSHLWYCRHIFRLRSVKS